MKYLDWYIIRRLVSITTLVLVVLICIFIIIDFSENSDDFTVNESYKAFVRLDKFNDSSIDILIICFTSTKDWDKYLQIKEDLAMEIKRKVEELNLSFAFPSQSIYIEKN